MTRFNHSMFWTLILGFQFQFLFSQISMEKIQTGAYRSAGVHGINSMNDGQHYSVQQKEGIVKYTYKNSEKTGVIYSGEFESYEFSPDEQRLLLLKESDPIYRHSFFGKYEVKDLKSGRLFAINNNQWVQEPLFSPDGKKVAFVVENNLYVQDLETSKITSITSDGKKNEIINGICDWVYEEEFGHARAFEWNKNSNAITFVRSDESKVKQINIPIYGNSQALYPIEMKYKYPKAGEVNSSVSLHVYHLQNGQTSNLDLGAFQNYYIPKLVMTQKEDEVLVLSSNRLQNTLDVLKVNTQSNQISKLFTETDKAWIETDDLNIEPMENGCFLWASERDGYKHFYLYDANGKLLKQITKGNWEVTSYYGFNPKTNEIFVQTTQNGSIHKVVTKWNIKTNQFAIISPKEGVSEPRFSKSFDYFINQHSSANTPSTFSLKDSNGKDIKVLEDNKKLNQILVEDAFVKKEFFSIKNENGDDMNAYFLKPKDFNPNKKYPVLMFVYGGPGSQQVVNSWDGGNAVWFRMLTQSGYIIACIDGRGTGFKGVEYKKNTYKQLGKHEIEDQIFAAKWLGKQTYIDANRIGMFGWSFGGYMTSLAMTKGADVFKMGIAVAPVTNWKYYDSIYTERFLQTPEQNPTGYEQNSPINFASLLKGKYLLIHGTADDNVHFQNSVQMSEALIQANKQFEFMAYPDKNHGIYGGKTRWQLYTKMTDFILLNL